MMKLLDVENLKVSFPARNGGSIEVVRGISFELGQERLGIIGESGSGKSITGRALMGLVRQPGRVSADQLRVNGKDLTRMKREELRRLRGKEISMILQDPHYSLNPVMTVGEQIVECCVLHKGCSVREGRLMAADMLHSVSIHETDRVMKAYPHEISGGMGQRVMIAMMLVAGPRILIADEPTSALDVSVRLQVLELMDRLVNERNMGLLLISHDLSLVSRFCDRVLIMYQGRIVETCKAENLHEARHPYTRGLLNAVPRLDGLHRRLPVLKRDPSWSMALAEQE